MTRAGLLCGGVDHVIVIRLGGITHFTVECKIRASPAWENSLSAVGRGHFPNLLRRTHVTTFADPQVRG